jgi:hypothetical protein
VAGCAAESEHPRDARELAGEAAAGFAVKREPGSSAATRVAVTRGNPSLPAGCRPRLLARRIAAFFAAFNRGDPSAVGYVDPSDGWYSVTDGRRRHFVTYSRRGLPGYFARRHRHGERLRLLEMDVSYARGLGHIAYLIDRRADDLRRLGITHTRAIGKGAVSCETGQIIVWSLGMPPGHGHGRFEICPPPRFPRRAIVACARRG